MFGVFGTISRLDRERERRCQSLGFYSGEYVVVLMIIIMNKRKKQEQEQNIKEKKFQHTSQTVA